MPLLELELLPGPLLLLQAELHLLWLVAQPVVLAALLPVRWAVP